MLYEVTYRETKHTDTIYVVDADNEKDAIDTEVWGTPVGETEVVEDVVVTVKAISEE